MPKNQDVSHAGSSGSAKSAARAASDDTAAKVTQEQRKTFARNFANGLWRLGKSDDEGKGLLLQELVDSLRRYHETFCDPSRWTHVPGKPISEDLLKGYWRRLLGKATSLNLTMPSNAPAIVYRTAKPDTKRDRTRKNLVNGIGKNFTLLEDDTKSAESRLKAAETLADRLTHFETQYCHGTPSDSDSRKQLAWWNARLLKARQSIPGMSPMRRSTAPPANPVLPALADSSTPGVKGKQPRPRSPCVQPQREPSVRQNADTSATTTSTPGDPLTSLVKSKKVHSPSHCGQMQPQIERTAIVSAGDSTSLIAATSSSGHSKEGDPRRRSQSPVRPKKRQVLTWDELLNPVQTSKPRDGGTAR